MRKEWESSTLGESCQIKPPKKEARNHLAANDMVSFAPMNNLGIREKDFKAAEDRPLQSVSGSYTYFAEGDVLLAKITPCFENGKLGIARRLTNGIGFGSSEFIVFRPGEELDAEYLFYFLSQDSFRDAGAKVMSGAVGHKRVPKEFIENFPLPLPPLPEQKIIVAILDEAFAGIDAAIANTKKNLANARELFESYLIAVFSQQDEGWSSHKLSDLGTITSSKRIFKSEYTVSGVPFFRTKEVKELAHDRPISKTLFISNSRYEKIKSKYGVPMAGDILLTAIGTIGEIYVVEKGKDFYFKDGNVLWLKNFNSINPHFLKYAHFCRKP